ncbi:hypothetical protein [Cohnella rhizosphaerae]
MIIKLDNHYQPCYNSKRKEGTGEVPSPQKAMIGLFYFECPAVRLFGLGRLLAAVHRDEDAFCFAMIFFRPEAAGIDFAANVLCHVVHLALSGRASNTEVVKLALDAAFASSRTGRGYSIFGGIYSFIYYQICLSESMYAAFVEALREVDNVRSP